MTVLTRARMTVDQFLAWAEGRLGRHELYRGEVYAMSPETAGHAETKAAIHMALLAAIRARGLPCHVLPDGMTVRIDDSTAFEPDAVVYSGEKLPRSAIEVPTPLIVVEVLSPSTAAVRCLDQARRIFPCTERCALSDCRSDRAHDCAPFPRAGRRHSHACRDRGRHQPRSAMP